MADLVITAADVRQVSGGTFDGTAGATVTAGQAVYADVTDGNKLKPALASADAEEAAVRGIALHGSLDEQPLKIQTGGVITIGATVVLGEPYFLSQNAGGICPAADLGASEYTSFIGIATSVTQITMNLINSGVEHA